MKTLHKFILKSYLGPFFATFFIAEFVLLMRYLFVYIDEFVGKDLGLGIITEFVFYASLVQVPLALPLSILLSSLMSFGNLGEYYELTALKSSGLSLPKIMKPLFVFMIGLTFTAFYFLNNIFPIVFLKLSAMRYDIKESKPAVLIKEGIFYNGIEGYSIRVAKKDKDGKTLRDIMIYDHTNFQGNNKVLIAESGRMEMSPDKKFLVLTLFNGINYEEMLQKPEDFTTRPLARSKFKEQIIRYDLSGFKLKKTDEDLFKNSYQMLNISQLSEAKDSLVKMDADKKSQIDIQIGEHFYGKFFELSKQKTNTDSLKFNITSFPKNERLRIYETALNITRSANSYLESSINEIEDNRKTIAKHDVEWHRKFSLSFACILLFFIGAPLGAIIRKGGLGMPVVISTIIFLSYHIISISSEKIVIDGSLKSYIGMWISAAVMLPLGIFLTYKATNDSAIFNLDAYTNILKKAFRINKSK